MSEFKVGDKVKCISGAGELLKNGEVYTILAVCVDPTDREIFLTVDDNQPATARNMAEGDWNACRFVLVESSSIPPLQKNDRVTDEAGNLGTVLAVREESGMVDVLFDKFGSNPLTAIRMPVGKVTRVGNASTLCLDGIPLEKSVSVGQPVSETAEDTGSAATSKHYNSKLIQPIEIAQMVLTSEEFKGAMKFNIMKYTQRAGSKEGESSMKDWNKAMQYKMWLELAEKGVVIDPKRDVV